MEDNEICKYQKEIDCLRSEIKELDERNKALNSNNESMKLKIRFLEGEIEAYQYCMNCRRY